MFALIIAQYFTWIVSAHVPSSDFVPSFSAKCREIAASSDRTRIRSRTGDGLVYRNYPPRL